MVPGRLGSLHLSLGARRKTSIKPASVLQISLDDRRWNWLPDLSPRGVLHRYDQHIVRYVDPNAAFLTS